MKPDRILGIGAALALGLILVLVVVLFPGHATARYVEDIENVPARDASWRGQETGHIWAPEQSLTPTLSIEPALRVVDSGDVFTVSVVISDVTASSVITNLGGFEFTLAYSPAVVIVQDVISGPFLTSSGGRIWVELEIDIDNISGTTRYGVFSLGAQPGPSGQGAVAIITLQAVAGGTSPLDLTEAQATDTQLVPTVAVPELIDGQVLVRQPGVDVCCDSPQNSTPGTQVIHTFTLTNAGNFSDSFTLAVAGNAWDTTLPFTSTGTLTPDGSVAVNVTVDIPHQSPLKTVVDSDAFTLTATSDHLSTTLDTVVGTTNAEVTPDVLLSANTKGVGLPGTGVTHSFTVTNTGNYTDNLSIAVAYGAWVATPSVTETGPLAADAPFDFQVTVDIPVLKFLMAADTFTVTVTSSWDVISDTAIGTTNAEVTPGVTLSGDTVAGDRAGTLATHSFVVANSGDYTDSFAIAIADQAWTSTLSITDTGDLMADASLPFTVTVEIPGGAASADSDTFTVTATSERDGVTADTAMGTTRVVETAVSITPTAQADSGLPGTNVAYTYTVTNDGDYTDTFALSLTGNLWPTDLSKYSTGDLDPGESFDVQVKVHIPHLAGFVLSSDAFTLTATSGWNAAVFDEVSGTTDQVVQPGVMVADTSVADMPGTTVTHTVTITNDGDYTDTFALTYGGNQWATVGPAVVGPLGAGVPATFQVTVDIPDFGGGETLISDTFVVTATSGFDANVFDEATGTTHLMVTPGVSITPPSQSSGGLIGDSVIYTFTVTNDGDYTDTFVLSVSGNAWSTELSIPNTGNLAPGGWRTFRVTVTIPAGGSGFDIATVKATSGWNTAVAATAQATTTVEEFRIYLPLVVRNH